MKKIGILTYFWADNPGTFLQAYATQEAFRKCFPDSRVELVDYKHRRVYFKPGRRHIDPRQLYRDFRRYRIYQRAQAEYLNLSAMSLTGCDPQQTIDFINGLDYDMLVAGADTILQLLPHHRQHNSVPVYWLPPELKGARVMCGSSCRALTLADLTEPQRAKMKMCVNTIPLLGVRDQATYDLILSLGLEDQSKLRQIPDPTFSLDIDHSHAEAFVQRKKLDFSRPCMLIALPATYPPARQLAEHFRSQGYRIMVFGNAPYADIKVPDISPFAWAGLYKYLDAVITDRFHGSLFSIRNHTPAVSIICGKHQISGAGNSKYASLWKLFGLEQTNWISGVECTDFDAVLKKITDGFEAFRAVSLDNKLDALKNEYLDFVKQIALISTRAY